MEILLLFTLCCFVVFADTHSLVYLFTGLTHSVHPEFTAVGLLDGRQFMSYSSSNMKLIPEDWIKNSKEDYWKSEEQDMQGHHDDFQKSFTKIKNQFNHSTGHILQRMYGCTDDDDTKRYDQYGFDAEDFIHLDLKTGTWTAVKSQAKILKHKWESNGYAIYWRNFLQYDCNDLLDRLVTYSQKKGNVPPETSLFQKQSPPGVVCHATGFFPKALNISWQKDGQDVLEEGYPNETLPNQDGSFQKRSVLKVSAEDLQKHNYTCVIQHSSLEKDLVLRVSERRILRGGGLDGGSDEGSDGGSDGGSDRGRIIIIGAVVAVVVIVVGIMVWKKKKCGFKPVPPEADSEQDYISNSAKA